MGVRSSEVGAPPSSIGAWVLLVVSVAALAVLFERTLAYQRSVLASRPTLIGSVPRAPFADDRNVRADGVGTGTTDVGAADAGAVAAATSASADAPSSGRGVAAAGGTTSAASNPPPDPVSTAEREAAAAENLDALRLLLAEAAALTATAGTADESVGWRRADLAVLAELSFAIRFARDSAAPDERTREILDSVAAVLARRPEAPVTVEVGGGERSDAARDRILRRERGRAIIAALVERGLAFTRFSLDVTDDAGGSTGAHRIRIVPREDASADR